MFKTVERPDAPAAIRMDIGAIFVSLELSRSTWLLTSVSPGAAEKYRAGDGGRSSTSGCGSARSRRRLSEARVRTTFLQQSEVVAGLRYAAFACDGPALSIALRYR